jgi:ribonuclease HII
LKHEDIWENQEKLVKLFSPDICIGIDEVGRGSLAGPVIAVAVALRNCTRIDVYDSKKVLKNKRKEIFLEILRQNPFLGIGVVSQFVIDKINILNATKLAMNKALSQCLVAITKEFTKNINPLVLIDGNFILDDVSCKQIAIKKGDSGIAIIAVASIIAKVVRDEIMNVLDTLYPNYSFSQNKGYGTKEHILAISNYGFSHLHRLTFKI